MKADEGAAVEWIETRRQRGTGSCLGCGRLWRLRPNTDSSQHLLQRFLLAIRRRQFAWFNQVVFEDLMHVCCLVSGRIE